MIKKISKYIVLFILLISAQNAYSYEFGGYEQTDENYYEEYDSDDRKGRDMRSVNNESQSSIFGLFFGDEDSSDNGYEVMADEGFKESIYINVSDEMTHSGDTVSIMITEKRVGKAKKFDIAINEDFDYESLSIIVEKCHYNPNFHINSQSRALINIKEIKREHFKAWIFSQDPGVSFFKHENYDIQLLSCFNKKVSE